MAQAKDGLAKIIRITQSNPQLSHDEHTEYQRIIARLCRAKALLRRATKKTDEKAVASAHRSIARAEAARELFVAPRVIGLYAPERIIARFEGHWSGPSARGVHRHVCEMVLDHRDISGPQYRTVRVISDTGAPPPPTTPRSAPDAMGVAWFAIADMIKRGRMTVITEEKSS